MPLLCAALALHLAPAGAAVDLESLWDARRPALSEQRLRAALDAGAQGDDRLVLLTQIARTHSLRRDFERARAVLAEVAPRLAAAGPEPRVRFHLERGRCAVSATHLPAQLTEAARAQARADYQAALDLARAHRLDALAIDAVHMMAFVDPAPADQLRWSTQALALARASDQPAARRWEASALNNVGLALRELGRHAQALERFEQALAVRERGANPVATRVARWQVARSLRDLGRQDEALALQQRLERENDAAGTPDPHVFEELEALHAARGEIELAARYAARRRARH